MPGSGLNSARRGDDRRACRRRTHVSATKTESALQESAASPGANRPAALRPAGPAGGNGAGGKDGKQWFYTEEGQKIWADALQMDQLSPDMPKLLVELGVKYDPERLAAVLRSQWPTVYGRALSVITVLGGFFASLVQDLAVGEFEPRMGRRAGELRAALSKLGPSFVKVGQALSSRPDLLPQPYLDALSELQDRLPTFPTDIARTVIQEELGAPIESIFSEFSEQPVAAASLGQVCYYVPNYIAPYCFAVFRSHRRGRYTKGADYNAIPLAQVYKGRLRSTGEAVAIKVQRPGIGDSIAIDMLLLRRLMAVVNETFPQV